MPPSVDVFVSYATPDRDRVRPIVEHLESAGLVVWWDRRIAPGAAFDAEIQEALDSARCVLVVWSKDSVRSEWVITEANEGLERGVLVPICIDQIRPPLAFRRRQTVDATSRTTSGPDILEAVQAVLEGRQIELRSARSALRHRSILISTAINVVLLAALIALLARPSGQSPAGPAPAPVRMTFPLEGFVENYDPSQEDTLVALSPDADVLAYLGASEPGNSVVRVRRMDDLRSEPLPGTEGASSLFFSPGGKSVGFFRRDRLERAAVDGSGTNTIALLDRKDFWGASWGADDDIVYAAGRSGLRAVSVEDTGHRVLTELDGARQEGSHRLPHHVRGHRLLLFTVLIEKPYNKEVWVLDLDSGERQYLFDGTRPTYVDSGHILYARPEAHDRGSLWAVPFDPAQNRVTGSARLVQSGVAGREGTAYTVGGSDALVYVPEQGDAQAALSLVAPNGDVKRIATSASFDAPRLSNDGSQIAVARHHDLSKAPAIWIYEIDSGGARQFADSGYFPLWDSDDQGITFMQPGTGLVHRRFDEPDARRVLVSHPQVIVPEAWIGGGRRLLYSAVNPETGGDAYILYPGGERNHLHGEGAWSVSATSDERWVALCTWPRGIRVGRLPDFTSATDVAEDGYVSKWAPDDSRIYYQQADKLWSVRIAFGARSLSVGDREIVAELGRGGRGQYDLGRNGEIVLVRKWYSDPKDPVILLNWLKQAE